MRQIFFVEQVSKLQQTVKDIQQQLSDRLNTNAYTSKKKISQWIKELQMLRKIAWFQPQAAYSCFITGFKHKATFYMKTIPYISSHIKRLDEVITNELIPAITGGINCSNIVRKLMSLPPKLAVQGSQFFSTQLRKGMSFHRCYKTI